MSDKVKNPLHYQIEVIRNVMLYCLDCYSADGVPGKCGTSHAAMMFLCNWLNGFGRTGQLPVSCKYLSEERVYLGQSSYINDALRRGGVVVVRLFYDVEHYVLLTGIQDGNILMFDPYYCDEKFDDYDDIEVVLDKPFSYNRVVPAYYFNNEKAELYALGAYENREAVLLFNNETKLTEEETIEYFI